MALIFLFAFNKVLKIPIEDYTYFLICGLFPWQWFANSLLVSTNVLISNATLIKKLAFPRYIIPLAAVLNDTTHFILSVPIVIIFSIYYDHFPSFSWLYGISILLISQFLLTFGLCLFISSLNLFFRDLERIVSIGLTILFYGTPIFYNSSFVPEKYRFLLIINPLSGIIENWRNIFMKNFIDFSTFWINFFYSLIIFVVGIIVFSKLSDRFAEVI